MHKQFKPPSLGNCERALYRTSAYSNAAYSNAAQPTLAITIYNIEYSLKTKDNTTIAMNKFHEFHKQNRNGTGTNNERKKNQQLWNEKPNQLWEPKTIATTKAIRKKVFEINHYIIWQ